MTHAAARSTATIAQATSLYAFLLRAQVRFIPVLSRPRAVGGILALDQLCRALHALDLPLLSLDHRHDRDQSTTAGPAHTVAARLGSRDAADADLQKDPMRYAMRRPARAYLTETAREVPDADLVLVHAAVGDLNYLLSREPAEQARGRRILLCQCATPLTAAKERAANRLLAHASAASLHGLRIARRAAVTCTRLVVRHLRRLAMRFHIADRKLLPWDPAGATRDIDPAACTRVDSASGSPEPASFAAVDSAAQHSPLNGSEMTPTPPDLDGASHVYR